MVDMPYNQTKPNQTKPNRIYLIMYKKVLTLNNLQWLMYHKTKPNKTEHEDSVFICFIFLNIRSRFGNSVWHEEGGLEVIDN